METGIFLQARTSSSRFPGKVLEKIDNTPLFLFIAKNLKKNFKNTIVLTSKNKKDEKIKKLCKLNKLKCFRGSLDNVLKRFYDANKKYNFDNIVRITGDCPFSDNRLIKEVLSNHIKNKNDYTSNVLKLTFPQGLDVEIFTKQTLNKIYTFAKKRSEKEHVTLFLRNNQNLFKCKNIFYKENLSNIRLTVDYKEDLKLMNFIFIYLKRNKKKVSLKNIIRFLKKNPKLMDFEKLNKKNKFIKYLKSY